MAKADARLSVKWTNDTLAVQVRGFMPETIGLDEVMEADTLAAIKTDPVALGCVRLGMSTTLLNVGAGAKDGEENLLHGRLMRRMVALRARAWEQNTSAGINWTVFPEALTIVLNARDAGSRLQADVQRKLIGMPTEQQAILWNDPNVQAECMRILMERAQRDATSGKKPTSDALLAAF